MRARLLRLIMKKRLTTVLVAALAFSVTAQVPGSEDAELRTKLKKKLASEFLTNANWFTDFDKARARAKATGKILFGYFTRSYSP